MARQGKSFYELSANAAADLSGKQYHFVRLSAADAVNQSSDAADRDFAGVLQNKPQANEAATVRRGGIQKVVAGASGSVHALITTNGSGRATAVLSGSNSLVVGRYLEAPGADGNIVTAEIFQTPYVWPGLEI